MAAIDRLAGYSIHGYRNSLRQVLSKISYYLKFLFDRQKQWVRTDRKNRTA